MAAGRGPAAPVLAPRPGSRRSSTCLAADLHRLVFFSSTRWLGWLGVAGRSSLPRRARDEKIARPAIEDERRARRPAQRRSFSSGRAQRRVLARDGYCLNASEPCWDGVQREVPRRNARAADVVGLSSVSSKVVCACSFQSAVCSGSGLSRHSYEIILPGAMIAARSHGARPPAGGDCGFRKTWRQMLAARGLPRTVEAVSTLPPEVRQIDLPAPHRENSVIDTITVVAARLSRHATLLDVPISREGGGRPSASFGPSDGQVHTSARARSRACGPRTCARRHPRRACAAPPSGSGGSSAQSRLPAGRTWSCSEGTIAQTRHASRRTPTVREVESRSQDSPGLPRPFILHFKGRLSTMIATRARLLSAGSAQARVASPASALRATPPRSCSTRPESHPHATGRLRAPTARSR